jgi:UDP-2-acetamido-2-deoxy-ribo-hexuluronate aminotransferase
LKPTTASHVRTEDSMPAGSDTFVLPAADVPDLEFAGLKAQYAALKDDIAPRLAAVFSHGRFIMGPEVAELEAALAEFVGAKHAIGLSSGTDALVAPMLAEGIGPGDAVFLPAFTFTATAEVPLLLGATPVFVDVDPRTFNIDQRDLEMKIAAVKSAGNLTLRAIMPVDLFGLPADYSALSELARAENLLLLSDAAQSFGAIYDNRRVGSLAQITATSFFPAKPFGCFGDGGAVFTDDDDIAGRIRSVRAHGQGKEKYSIERIGLNARLDTIQAAVLLGKLPSLADEITARNQLADFYDSHLPSVIETPVRVDGSLSAFAQYSILVDNRDEVQRQLGEAGIPSAIYYPRPLHLQDAYASHGDGPGSLPVSESLCGQILSLPMHAYMCEEAAIQIVDAVAEAVEN